MPYYWDPFTVDQWDTLGVVQFDQLEIVPGGATAVGSSVSHRAVRAPRRPKPNIPHRSNSSIANPALWLGGLDILPPPAPDTIAARYRGRRGRRHRVEVPRKPSSWIVHPPNLPGPALFLRKFTVDLRGKFRVFGPAEYRFYRSSTGPPGETYRRLDIDSSVQVGSPPPGPIEMNLIARAGGVVRGSRLGTNDRFSRRLCPVFRSRPRSWFGSIVLRTRGHHALRDRS